MCFSRTSQKSKKMFIIYTNSKDLWLILHRPTPNFTSKTMLKLLKYMFLAFLGLEGILSTSPQDCHCNPILTCGATSGMEETHLQELCKNVSLSVLRQQEENFFKFLEQSLDYSTKSQQCGCYCDLIRKSKRPRDCGDILEANSSATSGVYRIFPLVSDDGFLVPCNMDSELYSGGWTIFQRIVDGSADFNREWADYQSGFGNLSSSFWLGLDNINKLLSQGDYALMINMATSTDQRHALYGKFYVGPKSTDYMLFVGDYSGDAGEQLTYHNEMRFSTKDRDNDKSSGNCAASDNTGSGWWYNNCDQVNLNQQYGSGEWQLYSSSITFREMQVKKL